MVLTYGVLTVAGKLTWRLAGPLEQLRQQEAGAGLAVGVDDRVERVEPLLGLAGIGVGQLVDEAVEDHGPSLAGLPRE